MSPQPNVPSIAFLEKNLLATGERFVWLYEVEVPTSTPTRYRFVRDNEAVTFRGNVYSPFPITHNETKADDRGNLPTVELTVSNVSRELMSNLNTYGGLVGQPVRLILTHALAIVTGEDIWQHDYKIIKTTANETAVTATLGDLNLYDAKIPAQRMMRFYCRHQYMDAFCGYAVDSSHANFLASCDKTLEGANGCKAHGISEAAAGIPSIPPERFGGFPGIPEQTTGGTRL